MNFIIITIAATYQYILIRASRISDRSFPETKWIFRDAGYPFWLGLIALSREPSRWSLDSYLSLGRRQRWYQQNRIFVKCIRWSPNVFPFFFAQILRSLRNIRISRRKDKTKRNKGSLSRSHLIVDCTTLLEFYALKLSRVKRVNEFQ